MEPKLPSYAKPIALGVRGTEQVFDGAYIIQEKIDGSQISFGLVDGQLSMRSKGRELTADANGKYDGLFAPAVNTIRTLWATGQLKTGYVYRGEAVASVRHNVLQYKRVPKGGVILYDIEVNGVPQNQTDLEIEAARLGLEATPVLHAGTTHPGDALNGMLNRESVLGGMIEGLVVKNNARGIRAKFVSAGFKEVAGQPVPKARKDFDIAAIAAAYRTHARWNKAIQHLREDGRLSESPKDIGPLVKEIQNDLRTEETENIKQVLFDKFWPLIEKESVREFAQYYKRLLAGELPQMTEPSLTEQIQGAARCRLG